ADGEVSVELFHGQARAVARSSPKTLHRLGLASFDMTGYDAGHAEGFIRLFGLPLATAAQRDAEGRQGLLKAGARGEERKGSSTAGAKGDERKVSPTAGARGEERSDALEARGARRRSALRGARRSRDGGAERAARSSSPPAPAPGTRKA